MLSRLTIPYRTTVDLDLVDRRLTVVPHLEVLRSAPGAEPLEPAAVLLPTQFGPIKVDVLEVRQVELDSPSDDPGDRLHASAHAWAHDTATPMTLAALPNPGDLVEATTLVAEPGPLIAMKLQAVMNRSAEKQGTDLLDIVRLLLDEAARSAAARQLAEVDAPIAHDVALHVDLWFVERRRQSLRWIQQVGGTDVTVDDLDLVAEIVHLAVRRP
jgi:hypothetical protein